MARKKRPDRKSRQKKASTSAIGHNGIITLNGTVSKPDYGNEFFEAFRTLASTLKTSDLLKMESSVSASLESYRNLFASVNWNVEAYKDDPNGEAQEADTLVAEFLSEVFNDMDQTMGEVFKRASYFMDYGFSLAEIVFKFRGGNHKDVRFKSKHKDMKLGLRGFFPRPQRTVAEWGMEHESLQYIIQHDKQYRGGKGSNISNKEAGIMIPRERFIHFLNYGPEGGPEGEPITKYTYRSVDTIFNHETEELLCVEKDATNKIKVGAPKEILIGKDPESLATQEYLVDIGKNYVNKGSKVLLCPTDVDENGNDHFMLEHMQSGGVSSGVRVCDPAIKRCRKEIMKLLGTSFLDLGDDGAGSLNLSTNKTETFTARATALLMVIVNEINNHVIPQLLELNGYDVERPPHIKCDDFELNEVAKAIELMISAIDKGIIANNPELRKWILRTLKAPILNQNDADMPEKQKESDITGTKDPKTKKVANAKD